jgi:hypothetical protein
MMFGNSGLSETRDFWASSETGLTRNQTAVYETLVAGGADRKEIYRAIQDWRRADSYEEQRDIIQEMGLTEAQKLELYEGLTGAEARAERYGVLMDAGLSWEQVMDAGWALRNKRHRNIGPSWSDVSPSAVDCDCINYLLIFPERGILFGP